MHGAYNEAKLSITTSNVKKHNHEDTKGRCETIGILIKS